MRTVDATTSPDASGARLALARNDYDVIVLGGGSAGTSAAAAAVKAGARTLMVNREELGGLCILRGCMPTKALLASAHAVHDAERLEPFGARLEGRVVPDFARMMRRKAAQVERFQRAKIESVEAQEYDVLFGAARFAAGGGVVIDDSLYTARGYVIASGSEPRILPIPGIDGVPVWTSDDALRLTSSPARLLVQGGGAIGLELAQFFARTGSELLLVSRSPLLSRFDAECGEELARALGDEPRLEVEVNARIEELRPSAAGLIARIRRADGERTFEADALLMAAGRRAALAGLALENVGLATETGLLEHDREMRTARPDVYVAGDATGRHQLLHLANQEGTVAGHNAAGGCPARTMDYRLEMLAVFTDPPFAQVGLTEAAAAEQGREIVVGRAWLPETGRAITMEVCHGLWKLVADRRTGEILGSSIVGPRADDLVHLIALTMHYGGKIEDVFELPWYHPTLSEVMLTLARDATQRMTSAPQEPCDPTSP